VNLVLSILMLAAIGLVVGAFVIWRKTGVVRQPLLMLMLAVIAIANVALWTVPDGTGSAPLDKLEQGGASPD
jgi:hypothetical protein